MANTIFIYTSLAISIIALLLAETWSAAQKSRNLTDVLFAKGKFAVLNNRHLSGIIVFLICCWSYTASIEADTSIFQPVWSDERSIICLAITIIAITTGFMTAGNNRITQQGFPARTPATAITIVSYFSLRIIFLVLYEFFFRGVLLFILIAETTVFTAICINMLLYALLHCYSSRKELIGTFPFGLLLCMVTLLHHSVWPAVIIHLALAISHEIKLVIINQSPVKSSQL